MDFVEGPGGVADAAKVRSNQVITNESKGLVKHANVDDLFEAQSIVVVDDQLPVVNLHDIARIGRFWSIPGRVGADSFLLDVLEDGRLACGERGDNCLGVLSDMTICTRQGFSTQFATFD